MLGVPHPNYELNEPDIWQDLEEVNAITGPDKLSMRLAQIAAYEMKIADLDRSVSTADDEGLPHLLAKSAYLRSEAAMLLLATNDKASSERLAQAALKDALGSGYHNVIYRCLTGLGHLTHGADYYLMALAYSYTRGELWPNRHMHVLSCLGNLWSKNAETLAFARLTAHWARLLVPHHIQSWISEYVWLARYGLRVEIGNTISKGEGDTFDSLAAYASALLVVGQTLESITVLQAGQARARAEGAIEWEKSLKRYAELIQDGKISIPADLFPA